MLKRQWHTWMYNMDAHCHINTVHLIPCTLKSLLVELASNGKHNFVMHGVVQPPGKLHRLNQIIIY